MIEIVINRCVRGTLLSEAGCIEYAERKGVMPEALDRTDPLLIGLLKENPGKFGGRCSHVGYVTVPDGFAWKLMNKGNFEWIAPEVSGG
jgi:hypothetical protein